MSRGKGEGSGVEPALPITPMLDMAFQLLAFFIFAYHPSDLEGQMDFTLPSETSPGATNRPDVIPDSRPEGDRIDLPSNLTVMVRTQQDGIHNGIISALSVQNDSGTEQVDNLEQLKKHLEKLRTTVEHKDAIKIQADGKLKWDGVVQVMDACHAAGFQNISFVPPPDHRLSGQ
jgi:biopolymer transport protein ExbD